VRLLTYTNLYPSVDLPRHGIFVEERLRHLVATGRIDAQVCALRPGNTMNLGMYFGNVQHPVTEARHGLRVSYVPVPTLPLITNWIDPILWARASRKPATDVIGSSWNDIIIDAHFLYPDAVAAVILGRQLGLPVVMTARGSDVNVKCENPVMRRWVCWAATRCKAIIAVSQALADRLGNFGIPAAKIHVLPNGVDLEKFRPQTNQRSRSDMAAEGFSLLSVGHLVKGKGHHVAIEALANLPEATLSIIGEGPEEQPLRKLAHTLGVASRVCFIGYVPHDQMADKYTAADFTILASANEGMPNVMLESLACGTRVIATDVGGVGEVITAQVAGAIMKSRRASAVTETIRMLAESRHNRSETRDFATQFGWNGTVERQLSLYEHLLSR
jgi:teichuronic acid biosynthesis glycosyltransferase TuaC